MPATRIDKNGKELPTPKEKAFAHKYVETLNGTHSVLATYATKDPKTASVIASENLAKPRVRAVIEELMERNNVSVDDVMTIHRRNMLQDKHLPTSQKAVDSFHELLGHKEQDKTQGVNIAFIIEQ